MQCAHYTRRLSMTAACLALRWAALVCVGAPATVHRRQAAALRVLLLLLLPVRRVLSCAPRPRLAG